MRMTDEMRDAAILKAIKLGLVPRSHSNLDIAEHREKLGKVVEAALAAAESGDADEVERLNKLCDRAAAMEHERDKLIAACIAETWRQPTRTLANAEDSGVIEHGWEWRVGATGDFEPTREAAVAAVRKAAGLEGRP